jgi:hypothetical protein
VWTTATSGNGVYVFGNQEPGNYTVVETNPGEYPTNLLNQYFTNDLDPTDSDTPGNITIGVRRKHGATDDGNYFVESEGIGV